MSNTIIEANDATFQSTVLESKGTVVVDFWAPWCGPCRMQGPILERFVGKNEEVTVVKVNVDESPNVAQAFGIRSIPTIAVFEDGVAVLGAAGVQNEAKLTKLIADAKEHAKEHAAGAHEHAS
ncbi:MAG: thioredoxin [Deltaproteobacteria bacterium]|nr:thioredoxin [Deltaproteobacteria bacterium]